jgi:hypothetical protein
MPKLFHFPRNIFFYCPTPKLLLRAYFIIRNDLLLKESTNDEPVAQSMSELSVMTKQERATVTRGEAILTQPVFDISWFPLPSPLLEAIAM